MSVDPKTYHSALIALEVERLWSWTQAWIHNQAANGLLVDCIFPVDIEIVEQGGVDEMAEVKRRVRERLVAAGYRVVVIAGGQRVKESWQVTGP